MAKVSKHKLEQILTSRLSLVRPEFRLERLGNRWVGNIISSSFKGKRDYKRQELIWTALQSEFGPDASDKVGMLLAYTPEEWNLDAIEPVPTRKTRKAG